MLGGLLIGCVLLLIVVNNISLRPHFYRQRGYYRRLAYHRERDYLPPDYEDYYDLEEDHRSRYNNSRLLNALLFVFLLMMTIFYMEGQYKSQEANNQQNHPKENLELVNYPSSQKTY